MGKVGCYYQLTKKRNMEYCQLYFIARQGDIIFKNYQRVLFGNYLLQREQ